MIVKNCPAYYANLGCMSEKTNFTDCEKKDNCIIKQILKIANNQEINKLLEVEVEQNAIIDTTSERIKLSKSNNNSIYGKK